MLDRIEYRGLLVRFWTFATIQTMVVLNPPPFFTAVAAGLIAMLSAYFMFFLWANFAVEFTGGAAQQVKQQRVTLADLQELSGVARKAGKQQGYLSRMKQAVKTNVSKIMVRISNEFSQACVTLFPIEECVAEDYIEEREAFSRRTCFSMLVKFLKVYIFQETHETHKAFLVQMLGEFLEKMICSFKVTSLVAGHGILGQFLLVARVYKGALMDKLIPADATSEVKYNMLWSCLDSMRLLGTGSSGERLGGRLEQEQQQSQMEKKRLSPDDLHELLVLIDRFSKDQLSEILRLARELIEVSMEKRRRSKMPLERCPREDMSGSFGMGRISLKELKSTEEQAAEMRPVLHTSETTKANKAASEDANSGETEPEAQPEPRCPRSRVQEFEVPGVGVVRQYHDSQTLVNEREEWKRTAFAAFDIAGD